MNREEYAKAIIEEGRRERRGPRNYLNHPVMSERGIKIALATALVESDLKMYANSADSESLRFPHEALSSDANSVGLFQQRAPWWGQASERMDPALSAAMFYSALSRLNYNDTSVSPGTFAQQVQKSAFPERYDQKFGQASDLYGRLVGLPERPDFNEYWVESPSCSGRNGTKVDLWLIHTQEGNGNADSLARYLANGANQVSYHYTISEDVNDHGVTVCDVVDTDLASWSVLSANPRSINLCFAGSSVKWSREQWLEQSRAIDVAAYLCVQDCKKYGIAMNVMPPPYGKNPPGISDHAYVSRQLRDGNHSDCGPNFPWDVFAAAIRKYSSDAKAEPKKPEGKPKPKPPSGPVGPADDQLALRWNCLGGQTLVEAVAEIRDHLLGTKDREKLGSV